MRTETLELGRVYQARDVSGGRLEIGIAAIRDGKVIMVFRELLTLERMHGKSANATVANKPIATERPKRLTRGRRAR